MSAPDLYSATTESSPGDLFDLRAAGDDADFRCIVRHVFFEASAMGRVESCAQGFGVLSICQGVGDFGHPGTLSGALA